MIEVYSAIYCMNISNSYRLFMYEGIINEYFGLTFISGASIWWIIQYMCTTKVMFTGVNIVIDLYADTCKSTTSNINHYKTLSKPMEIDNHDITRIHSRLNIYITYTSLIKYRCLFFRQTTGTPKSRPFAMFNITKNF